MVIMMRSLDVDIGHCTGGGGIVASAFEEKMNDVSAMVDQLTRQYDQLLAENKFLRKKLSKLIYVRSRLLAKNHDAAAKIKDIIVQLKKESE
jgi:uncharacterized protein (TIGR02449 family)